MKRYLLTVSLAATFVSAYANGMHPCGSIMGPMYPSMYQGDSNRLLQGVEEIRAAEKKAVGRDVRLIIDTQRQRNGRGTNEFVEGTVTKVDVDGTNRNTVTYTLTLSDGSIETHSLYGMESLAHLEERRSFIRR